MSMERQRIFVVLSLFLILAPKSFAEERATSYETYSEFRGAVIEALARFGSPAKQSADARTLPEGEQGLASWLNWGASFVSDEPELCPSAEEGFAFSYTKVERSSPHECYSIDGAKRVLSQSEPPACDQQNSHFFVCFD
jgi:hypothetical protein